ncbi:MAG: RimK family alpha-L-glutamate ligase [Anaerosomatales bacterium]|nr:RimK family alpha-L-glutamate ligase [Anaerosomatales bacterium]
MSSAPIIAFLSSEARCHSRTRFEEEARGLGLSTKWLDPEGFDLLVDAERPHIYYRSRPFHPPAALIPRTGSDTTLFARAVIRQIESMPGVVVVNSSDAVMAARDKLLAHQMLAAAGVPFPKTVLARKPSDVAKMVRLVGGPPVVLKLISGTHGKGVMLGKDLDEIQASLETVWALNQTLLIQEYVGRQQPGTDIRVIVVGGRVLGAMKRVAKLGRFRANVHQGATVEPYGLTEELEWLAVRATEAMGLDVAGVDIVETESGFSVIEVNSAPGFEGFERATGINVAAAILRYARFRLAE